MPYVDAETRMRVADSLKNDYVPQSPGELSYIITLLARRFLGPKLSYSLLAQLTGVLLLTLLEIWDRIIRPYEQVKRQSNGDVF